MFPTQGSNLRLPHWQADSLPLSHLGKIDWIWSWLPASSLWELSIHCTILWNVLCFPQFLNISMNLSPPSCQFQMCNIAYFISFYFKCEPTLWTLYISVNLRKQKRNNLSHYTFRGECREKYVCCTQISLWWNVNYDKSNR